MFNRQTIVSYVSPPLPPSLTDKRNGSVTAKRVEIKLINYTTIRYRDRVIVQTKSALDASGPDRKYNSRKSRAIRGKNIIMRRDSPFDTAAGLPPSYAQNMPLLPSYYNVPADGSCFPAYNSFASRDVCLVMTTVNAELFDHRVQFVCRPLSPWLVN